MRCRCVPASALNSKVLLVNSLRLKSELVLELDSRLISKSEFEGASQSPSAYFKEYVLRIQPSIHDQLTLYGFRHNKHPSAGMLNDATTS